MSYLDRLRFSERVLPPTVETAENPEKAIIDSLDSTPRGPFQKIECTASLGGAELDAQVEPHRLWDITEQGGVCWRSSFCPHKTREEVLAWNPGALSAEPYQSPAQPPGASLSDAEGARVRAWLASIGETDPATIGEVLDRCEADSEARTYFLGRAGEVDTWDDRRTCRQCANLAKSGRCRAAGRGELLGTAKRYTPPPDTPRRCEGYAPGASDPDRRPGRERWPG
jgi:hypothetical protein